MDQATLMVHRGGIRVPREHLREISTPEATSTWKPLPHYELVDAIHEEVARREITVIREEYAVQRKQNMLVAIMVLNWMATDEFAAALAFRHSNDMSEAVKLYAGVRVFACDNTSVSGDEIILRKKHTKGFNIREEIPEAFDRYKEGTLAVCRGIDLMKAEPLTNQRASMMIYDIFRRKIVPLRLFHPTVASWNTTEDRTVWGLHNAFTTHTKTLSANGAMYATIRLGKFFGLGKE